jgi:hypothetical protein
LTTIAAVRDAFTFTGTPSLWTFQTGAETVNLDPRQWIPTGAGSVSYWCRIACTTGVSLLILYSMVIRITSAVTEASQATQVHAVAGPAGIVSEFSVPIWVAAMLAMYVTLFGALAAAFAILFAYLSFSTTAVTGLPEYVGEFVSLLDIWVPVGFLVVVTAGYAIFNVTIGSAMAFFATLKGMLPAQG